MLRGEYEEAPTSEGLRSPSCKDRVWRYLMTLGAVPSQGKVLKDREYQGIQNCKTFFLERNWHLWVLRAFVLESAVLWSRSWQHQSWWSCRALREVLEMILYKLPAV